MNYYPLPGALTVGMRLANPRYDPTPEILEVAKVDEATGRIYLMRENGVMFPGLFDYELLRAYDYQLVDERKGGEK